MANTDDDIPTADAWVVFRKLAPHKPRVVNQPSRKAALEAAAEGFGAPVEDVDAVAVCEGETIKEAKRRVAARGVPGHG